MPWLIEGEVALATAGFLVLGCLGVRVYRDVVRLSRALDSGARRLSLAAGALEAAAEPLARATGESLRSREAGAESAADIGSVPLS
ncbi:hypothetical protein [Phaeacidiphilus oryzae]|jgi:hypothetical protein|uniref:hypothetical protein n=1 Tax=Phaeacidiphilus oryzae TaxID=348818 RepID=UPI00056AA6EA|nr:hypothetical protein [Phaeacidiphilus oryzae]